MKITIAGQALAVDNAAAAVREIINGGNPYLGGPGAGGPGFGGPGGPGGFNGTFLIHLLAAVSSTTNMQEVDPILPCQQIQQGSLLAALKVLLLVVSKSTFHSKFLVCAARINNSSKSSLLSTSAPSMWSIADLIPGVGVPQLTRHDLVSLPKTDFSVCLYFRSSWWRLWWARRSWLWWWRSWLWRRLPWLWRVPWHGATSSSVWGLPRRLPPAICSAWCNVIWRIWSRPLRSCSWWCFIRCRSAPQQGEGPICSTQGIIAKCSLV